jgi:uncharacterized protein YqhQ
MADSATDPVSYGGQAVINGVMMRGQHAFAVAVRSPDGELLIWAEELSRSSRRSRFHRVPFLRGPVMLAEALSLGVRSLIFSARVTGESGFGARPWLVVAASLGVAAGLFFVFPLLIATLIDPFISSALVSNLVEGLIRLGLLIGYIWAIGFLPEVQSVFGYHGAEHKAVHAWEAGEPLRVETVGRHRLEHPRCGTGFMLVVALLSIVVFAMFGRPDLWLRLPSRIVLLPFLAAVAYEFLKFGIRHPGNPFVSLAMLPGLRLQRLTTREPDPGMIEVAATALHQVLVMDGQVRPTYLLGRNPIAVDENAQPLSGIPLYEPMAAD